MALGTKLFPMIGYVKRVDGAKEQAWLSFENYADAAKS
jgi:hypothetical protein